MLLNAISWKPSAGPDLPRHRGDDGARGNFRAPARGAGARRGDHDRAVAGARGNLDRAFYSVDVRTEPRQFGGSGIENIAPTARRRAGYGRDWARRPAQSELQADGQ